MYQDKLLRYAIPAQKKYAKMYNSHELGLVSIASSYLQITADKFADLTNQFQDEVDFKIENHSKGYLQATMTIDGVLIIAVCTKSEFEKAGLL